MYTSEIVEDASVIQQVRHFTPGVNIGSICRILAETVKYHNIMHTHAAYVHWLDMEPPNKAIRGRDTKANTISKFLSNLHMRL